MARRGIGCPSLVRHDAEVEQSYSSNSTTSPTFLETGKYPERDERVLPTAEYIRRAIISAAVARQIRVLSTNSDGSKDRRDQHLALLGEGAVEQVVDPGRATVAARLADSRTGALSTACSGAINRWYGRLQS